MLPQASPEYVAISKDPHEGKEGHSIAGSNVQAVKAKTGGREGAVTEPVSEANSLGDGHRGQRTRFVL